MDYPQELNYPRRSIIRFFLKSLAKIFISVLTEINVTGIENFPQSGPYIVIGNHVSSFEPILMLIYTPHQLEYLGSGDIPIDPRMSFFTNLYRFIPVMRGQIDQKGLKLALNVLEQGGVMGIFPEGGIWDKNLKEPKLGTSWLSYKSRAKIVPIGFVGMNQALKNALTLKRPKVSVIIGKPLSFEEIFQSDGTLKEKMLEGAEKIISSIAELLPDDEIINPTTTQPKKLTFSISNRSTHKKEIISFQDQESFAALIEHPVIMDVFRRNLKLKVDSLLMRNQEIIITNVIISLEKILSYLETNPGFLPYRFGIEEALKMKNGASELKTILETNPTKEDTFVIETI